MLAFVSLSQQNKSSDVLNYIDRFKDIAVQEMKRTGVPASIKLAQGILESGSGKSTLAMVSNNHFGVKCKKSWTGERVYFDDDKKGECFRKYDNPSHSYRDQSDFLLNNPRYASLFELNKLDYKGWAKGLKKAGYATNPAYADKLIDIIERYTLQQYTYEALARQGRINKKQYKKYLKSIKNPSDYEIEVADTKSELPEKPVVVSKKLANKIMSKNGLLIEGLPTNKVSYINNVKVVKVNKGTSLVALAINNNIDFAELLDRNNIDNNIDTATGDNQIVYLKRKKSKSKTADYFLVQKSMSLAEVSQLEGIRLESLKKLNSSYSSHRVLQKGDIVWLR